MEQIENIAIVGMGALGILYGEMFVRTLGKEAVIFIADKSRIKKYREESVYCNNKKCEFQLSDGTDLEKPADLLIFAVKGTALNQAVKEAKSLVGKDTVILSLLNGIASEEIIGESLGKEHVLYCVAQGMDAVKLGNRLTYAHAGQICIGLLPEESEKRPMLDRVIKLFDRVQLPYSVDEDISRRLWGKWMLNVGVNQVVMVEQGTYGTVQKPGAPRETMKEAMREVILLAQKEGIFLTEKDLEEYVRLIDSINPDGMPSMRQDGIEKRPSEVEFFAGTVLKKAKKYGLQTPVNEELYKKILEIELKY